VALVRERLTVRLSMDGGASWPVSRVLHEGPAAYSALALLSDGAVGCLYEQGEQALLPYDRLTFATFTLGWLER
ncbi:glycoside hydrolase, partial [Myxococcota bacterium]|nr:glycoside hydrolase [Myxococcota bacterium]